MTIRNTRVTTCWPDGFAVYVDADVTGTVIEDSTLAGRDGNRCSINAAIQNTGGPALLAERIQMYHCAGCFEGAGTLEDSYADTRDYAPGQHVEDTYFGGGVVQDPALVIEHNTLLNDVGQTAAIFLKADFGPVRNVIIADNLLAGGGYTTYAGGARAPRAPSNIIFRDNRFSRGYFPRGGHYGPCAAVQWKATSWDGNVWDDTLTQLAPREFC